MQYGVSRMDGFDMLRAVTITPFELGVLKVIDRVGRVSGDKMIARSAAARRLEKKGLAIKGRLWYVTEEGRRRLSEAAQDPTTGNESPGRES